MNIVGILEGLLIAGVTGIISSVATIAAIKVDITWMKLTLDTHNKRLVYLERKHDV